MDGHVQSSRPLLHSTEAAKETGTPTGGERDNGLRILILLSLVRHVPNGQGDEFRTPC